MTRLAQRCCCSWQLGSEHFPHCCRPAGPTCGCCPHQLWLLAAVAADIVRGLYVFANDSATISADIVAGFMRALKAAQDAHQPPGGSSSLDVEPFIPLAADLLGYFRTAFSAALLPLLRLYAASGGTQLALTAVSPDLLQQELASLLNSSSLNAYYTQTARGCGTRPTAAAAAGGATLLAGSGGQVGR